VNAPITSLVLALAMAASPALATPERAAAMQAQQAQPAADPAPAAMPPAEAMPGAGSDEFPSAMMQAIAARDAEAAQAAAGAPEPLEPTPAAEPADDDAEPTPELSEAPAGQPVTDRSEVDRRAQTIAQGLRCPVCQGLSAADSQAESAIAMRTRAGDLVAGGYSDAQINAYFVERYGEWVLLEPPRTGRHWLIWLGPLAFLGLGALVIAWRMTAENTPTKATIKVDDADEDPYEKRILDELEGS
jgi:cytochrome c-type biogenesis protein CcmH